MNPSRSRTTGPGGSSPGAGGGAAADVAAAVGDWSSIFEGMVVEARLAEVIGIAEVGIASTIRGALSNLGLPVDIPSGLSHERILQAMQLDKKKAAR